MKRLVKRGDVSVGDGMNECELYRQIIRRAKTVRERAAESLRRSPRVAQEATRPDRLTPFKGGEGSSGQDLTTPRAGPLPRW